MTFQLVTPAGESFIYFIYLVKCPNIYLLDVVQILNTHSWLREDQNFEPLTFNLAAITFQNFSYQMLWFLTK